MSIATETLQFQTEMSKYEGLDIEIERMWGMKPRAILVVIVALEITKNGMYKCTRQMPGNFKLQEYGTSLYLKHIPLRKALSINY